MRKAVWILAVVFVIVGLVAGGVYLWDQLSRVPADQLEQVVRRDGVPLTTEAVPDPVLERLASNRVVILGENHFLHEHRELVAALLRDLHARGFRQYLFEWSQALDWLLADYVNGSDLMPAWRPPHDIGGVVLTAIRDFNRTLPESERIQVHGIDVTLDDYGGTAGWVGVLELVTGFLPEPGPMAPFLEADHSSFENHRAALQSLQADLEQERSTLAAAWGESWYAYLTEMVEVELLALEVRAIRENDYDESVRLREEAIHRLAERRIGEVPGGTLINFGNTHGQKEGLWGTEGIKWLGDYLTHDSQVAGSVMAVWVAPATILPVPGSGNSGFDLAASPNNELLLTINRSWPDQVVFLPLDDPLFAGERIPINAAGDLFVSAPKLHYDAVILLPSAQSDYVGD